MDPSGNTVENVSQHEDNAAEIHSEISKNKSTSGGKSQRIRKFLKGKGTPSIRRTSSFMLKSRTERGGTNFT